MTAKGKRQALPILENLSIWNNGTADEKNKSWTFFRSRMQNFYDREMYMLYDIYGREELSWSGITPDECNQEMDLGLVMGLNNFKVEPGMKNGANLTRRLKVYCERYIDGQMKRIIGNAKGVSPYYVDTLIAVKKAGFGYDPETGTWRYLESGQECSRGTVMENTVVKRKKITLTALKNLEKVLSGSKTKRRNAQKEDSRLADFENRRAESSDLDVFLASIPEEDKNVFVDRYLYGYTLKELSRMYSMPVYEVKDTLDDVRCKGRKVLAVDYAVAGDIYIGRGGEPVLISSDDADVQF